MYIISVIPISNIPRQDMLSYFYKENIALGSLVQVPYNNKQMRALVVSSVSVATLKSDIKSTLFQIKKVSRVEKYSFVQPEFIEKIKQFSKECFTPIHKILFDIYPKWYWDNEYTLSEMVLHKKHEIVFLEDTINSRISQYEKYILKHDFVWIVVPTNRQIKAYSRMFSNMYKQALVYSCTPSKTKQHSMLREITETQGKKIIISTPYYAGIFIQAADLVIIENFADDAYSSIRPDASYNTRDLICALIQQGQTHIYADTLLPLHTHEKFKFIHKNSLQQPTYTLYTKKSKRASEIFVHEMMEHAMTQDIMNRHKIALVTLSLDSNQTIACNDCNTIVTCTTCASVLVLSQISSGTTFYCKFCRTKISANQKCISCKSWNLHSLGINKKTVESYLRKRFTTTELVHVDIITVSDLSEPSTQYYDTLYLISLDALMYSSNYRTEEKLYRILRNAHSVARSVSIQTSFPAPNILNVFKTISFNDWLTQEYTKRKKNFLPPFGITYIIKSSSKKSLLHLDTIEQTCINKNIRYIRYTTTISLFVPTQYESSIDTHLFKFTTLGMTIQKEKALFLKLP